MLEEIFISDTETYRTLRRVHVPALGVLEHRCICTTTTETTGSHCRQNYNTDTTDT